MKYLPRKDRDSQELFAWYCCNAGIFAAGFAFCAAITGTPWLALSIACIGAALFWLGWEIERAVHEDDL